MPHVAPTYPCRSLALASAPAFFRAQMETSVELLSSRSSRPGFSHPALNKVSSSAKVVHRPASESQKIGLEFGSDHAAVDVEGKYRLRKLSLALRGPGRLHLSSASSG
jgi:hypothetical protein